MAAVRRTLPYLVKLYQYCSSHHAGDMMSVTESGFFGGVRNRSIGDRVSRGSGCSGSASTGTDKRDASGRAVKRCGQRSAQQSVGGRIGTCRILANSYPHEHSDVREKEEWLSSSYSISIEASTTGPSRETISKTMPSSSTYLRRVPLA